MLHFKKTSVLLSYLGVGPLGVVEFLALMGASEVLGVVWVVLGVSGPRLGRGVEGADLGMLGLLGGGAVGVAGDFGVLDLLHPSRVLRVMRLGCDLVFRPCGVCFSSEVADAVSFSCTTGEGLVRGTGEAVRPLPEVLLPFFSLAVSGVMMSSCGRSFSGIPSSSSSKDTKEQ